MFCGTTSVILVDQQGCHWDCKVNCETRNDLRLQFTLSGQFTDYWDSAGITSGDVLTFERDNPDFGKIRILRYPQGQGLDEALFGTQAVLGGHQYQIHPGNPKEATKGPPSLEHRWIEGQDGAVMRVLNRVEIAQGQCSLAAGVFQKLYDRPPEDLDTAPMMDTTLGRSYIFQVSLIPGFEDHCITVSDYNVILKYF